MNILFVTHHFPPFSCIASLRTGQWAKYWGLANCNVIVLTSKKYSFDGVCDLNMALPENVKVVTVDYIPIALRRFVGNSTLLKHPGVAPSNFYSFLRSIVHFSRVNTGSLLDIHDLWVNNGVKAGLKLIEANNFDVIVSSYGPSSAHKIASKIKKRHPKIIWVADYRDLWSDNHINISKGIFRLIEHFEEIRTVKRYADYITTVSQEFATHLETKLNIPSLVIENGFDPDEFPNWPKKIVEYSKTLSQNRKKTFIITYTGKIYTGKRDPSPLFRVLNNLLKQGIINHNDIEVHFYGTDLGDLEQLITTENATAWVKLKGQVSWEKAIEVQQTSDLLLFLVWDNPLSKGVLTGKLFEYIVSGKPILALGLDKNTAAGRVLHETKTGIICSSNEKLISNVIVDLITQGKIPNFKPDIKAIKKYSRKKQALKLLKFMQNNTV